MAEPLLTRQADLSHLSRAAATGDEEAWTNLVNRLDGMLHTVARSYRLGAADVDDVVQTTWLRALDHVDRLNDPGAIAGWLVTTTRREAMRTLQRAVREILTDDPAAIDEPDVAGPEVAAIARERRVALRGAVRRLPGRQRDLVASLLCSPSATYERVAIQLAMPMGSIGPTRDRALARLREDPELERAVRA
jgi:RNA polymerase sigma factor (sigma-70 family)